MMLLRVKKQTQKQEMAHTGPAGRRGSPTLAPVLLSARSAAHARPGLLPAGTPGLLSQCGSFPCDPSGLSHTVLSGTAKLIVLRVASGFLKMLLHLALKCVMVVFKLFY